jgi:hypothetical protein
MPRIIIGAAVCLCFLTANATTITYDQNGHVESVQDLVSLGYSWDISFHTNQSYDELDFDYSPAPCWDAAYPDHCGQIGIDLNNYLNAQSTYTLTGGAIAYIMPWNEWSNINTGDSGITAHVMTSAELGEWDFLEPVVPVGGDFKDLQVSLASFTATAVVPVPAAAWLFVSSLTLMGLIRRRKISCD